MKRAFLREGKFSVPHFNQATGRVLRNGTEAADSRIVIIIKRTNHENNYFSFTVPDAGQC